jgi:hypothetical protein
MAHNVKDSKVSGCLSTPWPLDRPIRGGPRLATVNGTRCYGLRGKGVQMAAEHSRSRGRRDREQDRDRYFDILDPDFQQRFRDDRQLSGEQVELAVRHGLLAQPRFADRPFREIVEYLRESWEGMGSPAPWDAVKDIVCSAYEWQRAAGVDRSIELGEDALDRFARRTLGGSGTGGTLGDTTHLGGSAPAADTGPLGGHEQGDTSAGGPGETGRD